MASNAASGQSHGLPVDWPPVLVIPAGASATGYAKGAAGTVVTFATELVGVPEVVHTFEEAWSVDGVVLFGAYATDAVGVLGAELPDGRQVALAVSMAGQSPIAVVSLG